MNLLLISIFFTPEVTGVAPYSTGLARYLQERGHAVSVITSFPNYPHWRVDPFYRGRIKAEEQFKDIPLQRRRAFVPKRHSLVGRTLYESSFFLNGLGARRPGSLDAIVGVVPSLSAGALAAWHAWRSKSPFGLVFQDLVGAAVDQSSGKSSFGVASAVSRVEGRIARRAAEVGIIAEGFRRYLEQCGVAPTRIHRLRNWARSENPMSPHEDARRKLGIPDEAVVCLHAGNMGQKQGLEILLEAAQRAQEVQPKLQFLLVGDGNRRTALEERARALKLNNVRFLPLQPRATYEALLAQADVLILTQLPTVTDMALPSKLTDYFAAGRPVVASVAPKSEAAKEVKAARAGPVVGPGNPDAIVDAIIDLVSNPTEVNRSGSEARRYATTHLASDELMAEWEAFVYRIAGGPSESRHDTPSTP